MSTALERYTYLYPPAAGVNMVSISSNDNVTPKCYAQKETNTATLPVHVYGYNTYSAAAHHFTRLTPTQCP
jgi:hypothetical protein